MKNFSIGLFIFVWIFAGITIPLYLIKNNENTISRREQIAIKAQRMEEYEIARNQLAIEVDNYISSVAPKANIDAFLMIDLCSDRKSVV